MSNKEGIIRRAPVCAHYLVRPEDKNCGQGQGRPFQSPPLPHLLEASVQPGISSFGALVCVCVCLSVCVCLCVYVYMCLCVSVCTYICLCMSACLFVSACMSVCVVSMSLCVCLCVCLCLVCPCVWCVCVCMSLCVHLCVFMKDLPLLPLECQHPLALASVGQVPSPLTASPRPLGTTLHLALPPPHIPCSKTACISINPLFCKCF